MERNLAESFEELWDFTTFLVIPNTELSGDAIAGIVGVKARRLRVGPRRFALAYTLHFGDGNTHNDSCFAVFVHNHNTWIVPTAEYSLTGVDTWPRALSKSAGRLVAFSTWSSAPSVRDYRDSQLVAKLDALTANDEPVLGVIELSAAGILCGLENFAGATMRQIFDVGEVEIWQITGH